jgi:putative membrane protein
VTRVEALLDEGARNAIEAAVAEAEARTSGEIVPVIVDRSDGYPGVRAAAAALLAFAAGVAVLGLGLDPWLWLPPAQIAAFALGYLAAGQRALLRWLIPDGVRAERVDRAAGLAFLEHGLVETRDRTGILIYVSLLEHRVLVLADRGIHERVAAGTWDGVVRLVLDGIREGRAEEGLVAGIRCCGEILAADFPPRPDDSDELSNRPRF